MTIQEAIDELKYSRDMCYFDPSTGETGKPYSEECERIAQALDIAIRALEHKPSVNDCVNRQTALDFIKNHSYPVRYDGNSIEQGMTVTGIEEALNEMPNIQSKQKTGQWLINSDGYYPYCSICKNEPQNRVMTKYCPNCGAKMEE